MSRKTMNWMTLLLMAAFSLPTIAAETEKKLEIVRYEVMPGNYHKKSFARGKLDSDLLPPDHTGTVRRKGLLTDGCSDYAPETGICYVFWQVRDRDSFVVFSLELKSVQHVRAVRICGQDLSPMYCVLGASLEYGLDDIDMVSTGQRVLFSAEKKRGIDWMLEVSCEVRAKFLNVIVWGDPRKRLNVTEIEVLGN